MSHSLNQTNSAGHRYFYNEAGRTYFGYDFVIEPDKQPDTFKVSFYDLSIGPLDFQGAEILNPAAWKKLPMPALPAPAVVAAADTIPLVVNVDPGTGQKLIDTFSFSTLSSAMAQLMAQARAQMPATVYRAVPSVPRSTPTVSGAARGFTIEDAELSIDQARVSINGDGVRSNMSQRGASGTLVWFYVPGRGRYVLSLAPRAELGFKKIGEVRGGVVTFTDGKDEFRLESYRTIAPGDSPYVLYVLRDPEWAPTVQSQVSSLLLGSVSPRELAALSRK